VGNNIKVLLHRPVPLAKHELGLFVGWTGGLSCMQKTMLCCHS